MVIPENLRKCVVFLGYKLADGSMRLAGSAFYLARDTGTSVSGRLFLVTARHVIEGIRGLGLDEVYIRSNTRSGEAVWSASAIDAWMFHASDPTLDVAMMATAIPRDFDHLVIPDSACVTSEVMQTSGVGLGDEVFVTGLFRHHYGASRNIPIVRVGKLAALGEEKVSTAPRNLLL